MIDEHTDLDWVGEGLPTLDASELDGSQRARRDLLAHITAAGEALSAHAGRGDRRSVRRRATHRRRRRTLQLGVAGVAAAAAAFAVLNVASDGHTGPITEAQARQIIAHAATTPEAIGDQVLAYTITDSDGTTEQTAENGDTPQDWAIRYTAADGTPQAADGQEDGAREFWDPATNTIYRDTQTELQVGLSAGDSALIGEMNAPGAKLSTDTNATTNDGRSATKVTSTETDGNTYDLWVDPTVHDRPLQFVWTPPSAPVQTTVWRDYQTIAPDDGTPSPARLSADYPSAKVQTLDDAAFQAARAKAGLPRG